MRIAHCPLKNGPFVSGVGRHEAKHILVGEPPGSTHRRELLAHRVSIPGTYGSVARVHEARLVGEHDGLDAVAEPELVEHATDVRLHRGLGDEERT